MSEYYIAKVVGGDPLGTFSPWPRPMSQLLHRNGSSFAEEKLYFKAFYIIFLILH